MSTRSFTLYDLSCSGRCACWSPNVWKTRLVLNYKNIPYKSEFLEHPDISSRLQAAGMPPKPAAGTTGPSHEAHTLPALRTPEGTCIADSAHIVVVLEQRFPQPSLHLDAGVHVNAQALVSRVAFPLLGVLMPAIARNVIPEQNVAFWREKRRAAFGMSVDELERVRGGEAGWKAAEPGLVELNAFVREHKRDEGPFVLGSQPSYADFIIAALVQSSIRLGEGIYERIAEYEGIREVHQACRPWFARDQ